MEYGGKQFFGAVRKASGLKPEYTQADHVAYLKRHFGGKVKDVLRWAMRRAQSDQSDLDSGRILLALLHHDCSARDNLVWRFERPAKELIAEVESHLTRFPTNTKPKATEEVKLLIQTTRRECQKRQKNIFSDSALLYGMVNSGPTVVAYDILEKMGADFRGFEWKNLHSLHNFTRSRLVCSLLTAAENNDIAEVERILSLNIPVDATTSHEEECSSIPEDWTALKIAAHHNYAELYQFLIEHKADPKLLVPPRMTLKEKLSEFWECINLLRTLLGF